MSNESEASKIQENSNVEDASDGPQPMMNKKPCKTTPNSADQFWQSHQAEYEARGKRSADRVDRVNNHNAAYPVLKDELDKRRSTVRVTTGVNARRMKYVEYVCSKCRKLRKNLKDSECRDKSLIGNTQHKTKDRVIKRKPNRSRRPMRHEASRHYVDRSCRYRKKNYERDDSLNNYNAHQSVEKPQIIKEFGKARDYRNLKRRNAGVTNKDVPLNKKESGSESGFVKKPNSTYTDETSVTSYHSFSSMEHEPMVS